MSSQWIRVPVISALKLGNTHNWALSFFLYPYYAYLSHLVGFFFGCNLKLQVD